MTIKQLMLLLLMLSACTTLSVAAKVNKTKITTSVSTSTSTSTSSSNAKADTNSRSSSTASIPSSQLPLEARNGGGGDTSDEEEMIATSYVLPNQIFNDGKPYYAGKDPISGQLDFSAKKTAGIETAANEVYDPKEKIVLSNSSPNIHDFLNLPVKYSSSKFVYPLVSSSYANLKYQGNNKNYMTNKKPTSVETPVTPMPMPAATTTTRTINNLNLHYTIPTTKLMAVVPTSSTTTTTSHGTPTTSTSTTTSIGTTATATTSTSTTTTTSKKPIITNKFPQRQPSLPPTRYTTSTRKPIPITTEAPTYSTTTAATPIATTRKKFVPTKKYHLTPTTTTTSTTNTPTVSSTPPASPVRFPDTNSTSATTSQKPISPNIGIRSNTTTSSSAKPQPTLPTIASTTQQQQRLNATTAATNRPVLFTVDPTAPPSFSPLPGATRVPNLDAGDVYQTLGNKNTQTEQHASKPPMTLAELFDTIAEEDAALASNGGVFDAQGNLIQPIAPSKPSPFAMQGQTPASLRPQTSKYPPRLPPTPPQHTTRPYHHSTTPQDVISGSQENYSNEYVSYQVQQPNMMQYRPAPVPGAINNVVISPGQHSASFVLGSQQQVGIGGAIGGGDSNIGGGNIYGSVEKESLFGPKKPNVQYGTVINEDISSVATANGHQNGRPNSIYQSEPPAAPSPYQQLPLVNSNKRQKPSQKLAERPLPTALPQQGTTASLMTTLATAPPTQVPPQHSQELVVSSNIRFPPPGADRSEELPSGPIAAGPPVEPHVNGHAQPLSLQQIQNSNPVVFPKPTDDQSAGPVNDVQIQQHDVLTINQHKQKLNFPQNFGGPAQHMEPPPPQSSRFPPPEFNSDGPKRPSVYNEFTRKSPLPRPQHDRPLPNILPQFRPNAKVSSGHAPTAANYNHEPGNIRVPAAGQPPQLKRLPPPPPPQFAHRRQPLRYQYNNNNNRPLDYGGLSAEMANNRRVYRLPPFGGAYAQRPPLGPPAGAPPPLPTPAQLIRTSDGYTTIERHAPERLAAFEEEDLVINDPPQPVTASKDMQHVDETKLEPVVTLQMLQTQKKVHNNQQQHSSNSYDEDSNNDTGTGEIQVPSVGNGEGNDQQNGLYVVYPMKAPKGANDVHTSVEANNAGDADAKDRTPTDQVETSSVSNYQNTPFTVVRDEPQEPILKELKPKQQPQSLQQQQQAKQQLVAVAKEKFPYPIEKPDPTYTNLQSQSRVPGVLIAPRIINGAVGAESKMAPIAIAYTPTEPNPFRRYSNVNLATPVINEIRRGAGAVADTQTEQALQLSASHQKHYSNHNNNEFDIRGQYFEKDFMAPFYPSVSLDGQTGAIATNNKPTNGWNVLPAASTAEGAEDKTQLYAKNKIDRSDVEVDEDDTTVAASVVVPTTIKSTTTTKTFELDHFQPELQGGFKPIYPPGYKIDDEDDSQNDRRADLDDTKSQISDDADNKPLALASHMTPTQQQQQSLSSSSTSTTTSSTTTTTTTSTTPRPLPSSSTITTSTDATKSTTSSSSTSTTVAPKISPTPTQRKKSLLEALIFGDDTDFNDEDLDDESRQQKQASPINGGARPLHMVPRMGPRSLKLSS